MRQLIIHADDLGADEARNEGIFEAMAEGVVTAASILANGPAFPDVVQRIAAKPLHQVSFGVHLNLTEGRPLSAGLDIITNEDGFFHGKAAGLRLMMTKGDKRLEREVEQEATAQILKLQEAGIRIDHLDGHHHIHVFPAVIHAAVRVAMDARISWMRLPEETRPSGVLLSEAHALAAEAAHFSCRAAGARPHIESAALRTTDHFRGLYLKGRLSLHLFEATLQTLPPGLTELMVHPGRASVVVSGPFSSFSHQGREEELAVLKDPACRTVLDNYGIRLTGFPAVGE